MITQEQLKHFEDEGYMILKGAFAKEEMDELVEKIDLHVEEHSKHLSTIGGSEKISRANEITFTTHLVKKDEKFQEFCSQSLFVELATKLLGHDVSLFWDQAVYKRPETAKEFPWHQDNGYGLVLSEQYVTCWIALEDANVENGCIWVKPRTHQDGIVEHVNTPIGYQCYFGEDQGMPVPMKKGDMLVFSSLLFHKSGPNTSNNVRKGYIVQFYPTHAVNIKTGRPFKKMIIAKNGKAHLDTTHILEQANHDV